MLLPKPWCWAGICDKIRGVPIDVPAEVLWSCVKGMDCDPTSVVLHYVEPACYNPTPEWPATQGLEDVLARALSAGDNVMMTDVDDIDQLIEHDQIALFLATQMRDYGWIPRAMATVEKVKEKTPIHVIWPSLDDVRVSDFDPRLVPIAAVGIPIFHPGTILPDLNVDEDEETHFALEHCYREVMPEMSEAQFLMSNCVEMLNTCVQFSHKKRTELTRERTARYNGAQHAHPPERVLVVRAWLGLFGVRADNLASVRTIGSGARPQ
jgi:hypothetical protein